MRNRKHQAQTLHFTSINLTNTLQLHGSPAGALLFFLQQKKSKQKTAVPGALPS